MISVVIPSNSYPNMAFDAIASLISNAKDRDGIEFILRIDEDDVMKDFYYKKAKSVPFDIKVTVFEGPSIDTFNDKGEYFSSACDEATGDMFFLFNERAIMGTWHWDEEFTKAAKASESDKFILHPFSPFTESEFPVVSRSMCEDIGFKWMYNPSSVMDTDGVVVHNVFIDDTKQNGRN